MKLEQPILVPGNHDSRLLGCFPFGENKQVKHLSQHSNLFVPHEPSGLGFLRFDSNKVGLNPFSLARGRIDKAELHRAGSELDSFGSAAANLVLIALVHHHPISVQKQSWSQPEWYQHIFGPFLESTGEFENASEFLKWLQARRIPIVLHGHKHVPHASYQNGTVIVGCGSSTGKVKTKVDTETYLSFNVLTLNGSKAVIQIKTETLAGAGMVKDTHELIMVL